MVQPIAAQAFNVIDLEREIEAQFRNSPPIREQRPVNVAPPMVRAPTPSIPDYVEHCEGATGDRQAIAAGPERVNATACRLSHAPTGFY